MNAPLPKEMSGPLPNQPFIIRGPQALPFALYYEVLDQLTDPAPNNKTWRLAFDGVTTHPTHWIAFSRGWGFQMPMFDCVAVFFLPRASYPAMEDALQYAQHALARQIAPLFPPK